MSQRAVEGLLGRLITDGTFRQRFYQDPALSCSHASLELSQRELDAVLAIDVHMITEFAKRLNPKIIRATTDPRFHDTQITGRGHRTKRSEAREATVAQRARG